MQKHSSPQHLAALVDRISTGDQHALERLSRLTIKRLLSQAHSLLKSRADAHEVVTHVYLDAWRRAKHYERSGGTVRAWLSGICFNRAIDHVRRTKSWARGDDLIPYLSLVDPNTEMSPEELLLKSEDGKILLEAIERLSPLRRKLVSLAFFQNRTHGDIAAEMHLALGTVKSHIRRALTTLRSEMDAKSRNVDINPLPQN